MKIKKLQENFRKIASKSNLYEIFFLISPVYIDIVYKVVSVAPKITADIIPIVESTPYFCIISVAIAKLALLEIGFIIAKPPNSFGILVNLQKSPKQFIK